MVEIPAITTKAVINIQEDKMVDVAVVIGWVLNMIAVQSMGMVAVAANLLQEVSTETTVPAIGERVAAIGEPVAMKVVVAAEGIQKINIWEEDKTDSVALTMIIIALVEVTEVVKAELLVRKDKAVRDLQAGVVVAAVIGN
jgi:hypothetical protein